MTNQAFVERAETARDLKDQMKDSLGSKPEDEFQFYEWSPGRTEVSLWSMETGEEIRVPRYIGESALYARNEDGQYRFTADPQKAPERRLNSTMCLFHKDSPHRQFLEEAGVIGSLEVVCRSEHLAGESAMLTHAESKHKDRYRRYEQARERIERTEDRKRQQAQTEAMLKMAGVSAPVPSPEPVAVAEPAPPEMPSVDRRNVYACPKCDREFTGVMSKAHSTNHIKACKVVREDPPWSPEDGDA